jgi:5'-nucleotidase
MPAKPLALFARLGLALCFALTLLVAQADDGASAEVKVALIHVNDVYQIGPIDPQGPKGPRGGLARLSTLVHELRQEVPDTLFVFGGDTISPGVESGLFFGKQMIAAWNALGVDLAVPGNHEFDFGEAVARERFAESRFPWLAANLTAESPLPAVKPSELRTLNGVRVGFVGLLTPETATLSKPGPNLRFTELLAAARREAAALRAQGAAAVVGLTHCGLAEDRALAASGLFDLILGGHDHHVVNEMVGRTPIFKAGSDARDALHVRLRFAPQPTGGHRLTGMAWDMVPVDGRWAEDPKVLALDADYQQQGGYLLDGVVAETATALDARGETLRRGESNIGDYAADAVRAAMTADVAILNGGGFRSDRLLGPGPLTRRDLAGLLPFRNPLVLLAVTGAQLRAVLEHGIGQRVERGQSGAMPQVSGLRLVYDPRRPRGQRIVELSVGGQPLRDDVTYRLATSNYLAGGGDGYAMLKGLPVLRPAEGSPIETDVVLEAMQRDGRNGPITPTADSRVVARP